MRLEKTEKQLLYLALAAFILMALSFFVKPLQQLLQGIMQVLSGGNSLSETYFLLLGFIVLPLLCFIGNRTGFAKKLKKHEKTLLSLFIIALFAGYLLGFYLQMGLMQSFNARGPFAAMVKENDYANWQATSIYHNHIPKAGVYVLKQLMPFLFTGMEDDGRPLYEVIPNAFGTGIAFLLIELIVFVLGTLFVLSKARGLKPMHSATYFFSLFLLMIVMVNGGITSNYFMPGFFLLLVFLSMNYFKGQQTIKSSCHCLLHLH